MARAPRLAPIPDDQLTPEQQTVAAQITAGGKRGGIRGPFYAWMRNPVLAGRLEQVGDYLRFNSTLPPRLSELVILMAARHWDAQFEWYAHAIKAIEGGLDEGLMDALRLGKRPSNMAKDEAAIFDFVIELRRDKTVGDETYGRLLDLLGEPGVVDVIALSGYYDLVSMTLNVAEVPMPEGMDNPLPKLD